MAQRTETSADRAGLRFPETFRAGEGQPFRRGLSHRASQCMTSRLQLVKPHILLQKGANIDPQSIRQPHESLPLLFAQLRSCHKRFILERKVCCRDHPIAPASAQTYKTVLNSPIDVSQHSGSQRNRPYALYHGGSGSSLLT